MDAADEKLVAEIRSLGDRASNAERRLVAMVDTLSARLALADAIVDARRNHAKSVTVEGERLALDWLDRAIAAYDAAKSSMGGASPIPASEVGAAAGLQPVAGCKPGPSRPAPPLATTMSAGAIPHPYICQRCKAPLAGQYVVGIGGGYQHERCPEPAPRLVTLAQAKAWCEEMQANCGRMNERVPLPASLLAALEEEATGTVGSASEVGKASSGESEVRPSPEPPAQVCAHPGVMRRSEWLTSSGGVPARIYCQSCGQTLYPPAATPSVPAGIDPVRDVIGDYRCGVNGCTASVRRPGDMCAMHAVPAERECYCRSCGYVSPVDPATGVPCPKGCGLSWAYRRRKVERTYIRQEVDALLAGLRERCVEVAKNAKAGGYACGGGDWGSGAHSAKTEIRNSLKTIALWPVTEPERKGGGA